mmetsp:Transcript_22066/g.34229  ORF Transcript_22066/g.34229 Transcript_22066/m.34229 type:complete len:81 (+) Transcript_22066:228-470(+)
MERLHDALRIGDDLSSDSDDSFGGAEEDDEISVHFPDPKNQFELVASDLETEVDLKCGMIVEIAEELLGLQLSDICQEII